MRDDVYGALLFSLVIGALGGLVVSFIHNRIDFVIFDGFLLLYVQQLFITIKKKDKNL